MEPVKEKAKHIFDKHKRNQTGIYDTAIANGNARISAIVTVDFLIAYEPDDNKQKYWYAVRNELVAY